MKRPGFVLRPVAHQLTFAEAARRGIICRYKVVVSVVNSEMVNAHVLRHGEVIVQGDAVKARHVANQLALRAAVEKHGVSKIFTFHRSVASAAAFTGDGPEGIGNHLPGFTACHVNGAMPAAGREAGLGAGAPQPGLRSRARAMRASVRRARGRARAHSHIRKTAQPDARNCTVALCVPQWSCGTRVNGQLAPLRRQRQVQRAVGLKIKQL